MSVGSLYQYFPNKEALVARALEALLDEMRALIENEFRRIAEQPLASGTRELIGTIVQNHTKDSGFRAQFHELVARIGVMNSYLAYRRDIMGLTRRHLELHRSEHRRGEIDVAAACGFDLVDALLETALHHFPERLGDDAYANDVAAVVLDYLKVTS